jgi:TfoX/Sxy family transcriptional regulator of competence genes
MGTQAQTITHLLDALAPLPLSARKMFGEYALYLDGKVAALVCDDQLYLKPTAGAQAALPDCLTGPPYPGAKLHLLVTDALDDPDPVITALKAIARDMPPPKPKKPRSQEAKKPRT